MWDSKTGDRWAIFRWSVLFSAIIFSTLNAQEKPTLTIYTYDAFAADWGPGPKIKSGFEESCGCIVKFVAADSSIGALRKVQLEGTNTSADIVLGLDTNIAQAARETGLFVEHGIVADNLAIPSPASSSGIASDRTIWRDKTFLPFDYSYFAFVYNKTKTQNVPSSFEELAAMPEDFKIIIQDPRSSTPGLGLLLWIKSIYGEKAFDVWKSIAPKILTITKGWSDSYGLFLKGEADMVLSYTTSPAYHLIEEGDSNFASAVFAKGHYMQIEVAGILKSSKNQKLARRFMQFMLSEKFQDIIPTTNWTYPVIKTKKGLPEGFKTLEVPATALLMDGKEAESNRKQWIAEWLAAIGR
ncbi:MAG: thiamine ABC transporter substrate binding subunit [Rhizobiaceae bacterium]|nr:thiamine ABC transporter substrate binding subunit [Rhizobiaceae bacterium]